MTPMHSSSKPSFAALALLAVIIVVLAGCTPTGTTPVAPTTAPRAASPTQSGGPANALAGTEWQLESMLDGAAAVKVNAGAAPSIAFAVDRHIGFGGCDWFVGLHILKEDNGIQMEAPQKTMGGCTTQADLIEQQGTYMQLLTRLHPLCHRRRQAGHVHRRHPEGADDDPA